MNSLGHSVEQIHQPQAYMTRKPYGNQIYQSNPTGNLPSINKVGLNSALNIQSQSKGHHYSKIGNSYRSLARSNINGHNSYSQNFLGGNQQQPVSQSQMDILKNPHHDSRSQGRIQSKHTMKNNLFLNKKRKGSL